MVVTVAQREVDPRQRERNVLVNAVRFVLWVFFRVFYRVRWRYPERVPMAGPVILAPTHASFYDPPMVGIPLRRRLYFFTRDIYLESPLLGPLIRVLRAFPANLSVRFDRKAYEQACRVLNEGGLLVLFPEGTRTYDGLLGEIQSGVAALAVETGATIVPVSICGAFEVWPRTRSFPRFCRLIAIKYHRPIRLEPISDRQTRREKAAEVSAQLERILAPRLRAWRRLQEKRAAQGQRAAGR